MRKILLLALTVSLPVLTAIHCGSGGSGGPSGPRPDETTYRISGNTLVMTTPTQVYSYCSGSQLIHDTSESGEEIMPYSVIGDTLRLQVSEDTLNSGVVAGLNLVLTRSAPGSGLIGSWSFSKVDYTILSGTPTTAEWQQLDSAIVLAQEGLAGVAGTLQISPNVITAYPAPGYGPIDNFIMSWNYGGSSSDSAKYNITVVKVNSTTARLTGNVTGEVVTVIENEAGDMAYSSSVTGHAASTYYANPTQCPNYYEPDWYYTFETANKRPEVWAKRTSALPVVKKNILLMRFLRALQQ